MPVYLQSRLNIDVSNIISGTVSAADFLVLANMALHEVVSDIDMHSMKRRSQLSPNLFNDIWPYSCPADLKALGVIDIQPQIKRGRLDSWELTTAEEFDRYKANRRYDEAGDPINVSTGWAGRNLVAIDEKDFIRKLLISRPINDDETVIDTLDALGNWVLFGDGENLTKDADDYVKGSASINWDISSAGGTTAGIQNTSLDEFDISAYKTTGSTFVWSYISSITNLTNFILLVGNDLTTNYYSITITTNNEGNAFETGWNLLRFDFANKTTTGTVTDASCDSIAIYMTKDTAKVSETDYRFDNLVLKMGDHYYVRYYSKYGWQSSTGTYLENATATTDYINVDTDEYRLIVLKTAQKCEEKLLQLNKADRFENKYEKKRNEYELKNPSEALLLTQTMHDFNSEPFNF